MLDVLGNLSFLLLSSILLDISGGLSFAHFCPYQTYLSFTFIHIFGHLLETFLYFYLVFVLILEYFFGIYLTFIHILGHFDGNFFFLSLLSLFLDVFGLFLSLTLMHILGLFQSTFSFSRFIIQVDRALGMG